MKQNQQNKDLLPQHDTSNTNSQQAMEEIKQQQETNFVTGPSVLNAQRQDDSNFQRPNILGSNERPKDSSDLNSNFNFPSRRKKKSQVLKATRDMKKQMFDRHLQSEEYRALVEQGLDPKKMFNMVYTEEQIDAIPAKVFIKMLEDQRRMMRVMLKSGFDQEEENGDHPNDHGYSFQNNSMLPTLPDMRDQQRVNTFMSSIQQDSQASFIGDDKSMDDFESLIAKRPTNVKNSLKQKLHLDLHGFGLIPGDFTSKYNKPLDDEPKIKKSNLNYQKFNIDLKQRDDQSIEEQIVIPSDSEGLKGNMSLRGFDIRSPELPVLDKKEKFPSKKIERTKRTKVKKKVKLVEAQTNNKNNESFKIQKINTSNYKDSLPTINTTFQSDLNPGPKKCKKNMCADCGLEKPPPQTEYQKRQEQIIKKRLKAAQRKQLLMKEEDETYQMLKKLPGPLRSFLRHFGIGKPPDKRTYSDISYAKLKKKISSTHPVDPLTQDKFEMSESVTIHNYGLKLTDALFCNRIYTCIKKTQRKIIDFCLNKKKKALEKKPDSMKDVPTSSDESSDKNDTFKGLSKAAIHVGEGPILYLQIMKTFSIMCLVLSVINLPLFMMYSSTAKESANFFNMNSLFEHFSLGNIGRRENVCQWSSIHWDDGNQRHSELQDSVLINMDGVYTPNGGEPVQKMKFQCDEPHEYITIIQGFGFLYKLDVVDKHFSSGPIACAKTDLHTVQTNSDDPKPVNQTEYLQALSNTTLLPENINAQFNLDEHCNYHSLFKSKVAKRQFSEALEQNCYLKNSCEFDPENILYNRTSQDGENWTLEYLKFSDMVSKECFFRIFSTEITSSEYLGILSCQTDKIFFNLVPGIHFHKEELGLIAVCSDMFSVLVMYYVFRKLKTINQEYLQILDDNVIRMQDFTVQINKIKVCPHTQDLRILQLKIWVHMTELIEKLKAQSPKQDNVYFHWSCMKVADVNFSLSKQDKHKALFQLQDLTQRKNQIETGLKSGEYSPAEMFQKTKELEGVVDKIKRYEEKYIEAIDLEKFYAMNLAQCPKNKVLQEIEYCYVTFKTNQAPKKIVGLFVKEQTISKIMRRICCIEDPIRDTIEFEDQNLEVQLTVDPDQILWNNIGFTPEEVNIRAIVALIAQILIAFMAILIILQVKQLKKFVDPVVQCDDEKIYDPVAAYLEQQATLAIRVSQAKKANPEITSEQLRRFQKFQKLADPMVCYCKQLTNDGLWFWKSLTIDWQDYDPEGKEDYNYCAWWQFRSLFSRALKFIMTTSIITINGLISQVLAKLAKFKKRHTSIEEQSTGFSQIFFMEFFNMGIILLLLSFDPTGVSQSIAGKKNYYVYQGFENKWYLDQGKGLCLTLLMSAVSTNIPELNKLQKSLFARFKDRSYTPNIKKDLEDFYDDEVNTKLKNQEDLEALYTGGQFIGPKSFSRMMSILLVVVCYSSGLPVLYIVGFLFFTVTYNVNKVMMLKFYQKSLTLNRVVPLYSMQFLTMSLFIHITMGCFMMTNPKLFESISEPGQGFKMPSLPNDPSQTVRDIGKLDDPDESTLEGAKIEHETTQDMIFHIFSERIQYFHQQIYLAFVSLVVIGYICGNFIKGLSEWAFTHLLNITKSILQMIFKILTNVFQFTKLKFKICLNKVKKFVKSATIAIKRKAGIEVDETEIDNEDSERINKEADEIKAKLKFTMQNAVNEYQSQIKIQAKKRELEEMKNQIELEKKEQMESKEEGMTAEEKEEAAKREKIMIRFRRQILHPNYSDNIYMELNITNLKKFYERSLKQLQEINNFFSITTENESEVLYYSKKKEVISLIQKTQNKSDERIEFEEKCYITKLTFVEVQKYIELLKKRQKDIEEVIDAHFDSIKKSILKDKSDKLFRAIKKEEEQDKKDKKNEFKTQRSGTSKSVRKSPLQDDAKIEEEKKIIQNNEVKRKLQDDPDLQFSNPKICTFAKKLEQLYDFEETLLKNDKQMKENRRGLQTICRMQGSLTQSYFLWDSHEYSLARKIYFDLESRKKEDDGDDNLEEIERIYQEITEIQLKQVYRDEQNKIIQLQKQ